MEGINKRLFITIGCPPIVSIIEIVSYIKNPDFPDNDYDKTVYDPHYRYAVDNLELLLLNHFNGKYIKDSEEYTEFFELLISHQLLYIIDKIINIITMELPIVKLRIASIKIIDLNGTMGVDYH